MHLMAGHPNKKPWWKSAWARVVGALLVISWVVDVAGFVNLVKPVVSGIADAAQWLYPFWLVIGLAVLLLATTVVLVVLRRQLHAARGMAATAQEELGGERDAHADTRKDLEGERQTLTTVREQLDHEREAVATAQDERAAAERRATEAQEQAVEAARRTDPQRVAHDTRILRALRKTLPRGDIAYWGEVDFGGTWDGAKTRQLMELHYERDSVEDRFLDPELEPLRGGLISAARELMNGCAKWGGPSHAGSGLYDLGDLERVGETNRERLERFEQQREERREELGKRADRLVAAYDAVIGRAQERLPGAFEDVAT